MLRSFIIIIGLALALTACGADGKITPESVAAEIAKDCGIAVKLSDIAALITANPTAVGIAALAKAVCDAFKAQKAVASDNKSGVLDVGGVPVHYE